MNASFPAAVTRTVGRCGGFTLVELLVVVTILATLMALLFPAVQTVRESARRSACASNLKQLTLGCTAYEAVNRQFPYGRKYDRWNTYTWTELVLPWIEQQAVYDGYWTLPLTPFATTVPGPNGPKGDDSRMRTSRQTAIVILNCPSDRGPMPNQTNTLDSGLVRGNYSGCVGVGDMYGTAVAVAVTTGTSRKGIFSVDPGQSFDDGPDGTRSETVSDGCSNTILLSEILVSAVTPGWGGPIGETIYGNMGGGLFSAATVPNATVADSLWGPCPQTQGDAAYTAPCTMAMAAADWMPSAAGAFAAARSRHSAGVNVAVADGAVRFVSESVAPSLWSTMGTRAGTPGTEELNLSP